MWRLVGLMVLVFLMGCGRTATPQATASPDVGPTQTQGALAAQVGTLTAQYAALQATVSAPTATPPTATPPATMTLSPSSPTPNPSQVGRVSSATAAFPPGTPGLPTVFPSAAQVAERLRAAGLPIADVVVYTAATDPNMLLGRPGQYDSTATFRDTRVPATATPDVRGGGSVEVFLASTAIEARQAYVETIARSSPLFAEYTYRRGLVLLRVSSALTPEQAASYETVLGTIVR